MTSRRKRITESQSRFHSYRSLETMFSRVMSLAQSSLTQFQSSEMALFEQVSRMLTSFVNWKPWYELLRVYNQFLLKSDVSSEELNRNGYTHVHQPEPVYVEMLSLESFFTVAVECNIDTLDMGVVLTNWSIGWCTTHAQGYVARTAGSQAMNLSEWFQEDTNRVEKEAPLVFTAVTKCLAVLHVMGAYHGQLCLHRVIISQSSCNKKHMEEQEQEQQQGRRTVSLCGMCLFDQKDPWYDLCDSAYTLAGMQVSGPAELHMGRKNSDETNGVCWRAMMHCNPRMMLADVRALGAMVIELHSQLVCWEDERLVQAVDTLPENLLGIYSAETLKRMLSAPAERPSIFELVTLTSTADTLHELLKFELRVDESPRPNPRRSCSGLFGTCTYTYFGKKQRREKDFEDLEQQHMLMDYDIPMGHGKGEEEEEDDEDDDELEAFDSLDSLSEDMESDT